MIRDARLLTTWKAIAAYLGRDERTAKRWEATRALPVRRVPGGRSTVFAYQHELDDWLAHNHGNPPEPALADAAPRSGTAIYGPPSDAAVGDGDASGAVAGMAAVRDGAAGRPARVRSTTGRWLLGGIAVAAVLAAAVLRLGAPPHPAAAAVPDLYLQGVYAWNTRTRAGLTEAIADFSRVILDRPDYAPAYAGLADCYNLMPEYGGMRPAQAYPQAKVAAERAVALDDHLAAAHRALAFVDFWWSHDIAGSRHEFARALALDPNSAQSHHWYGNTLVMTGRPDLAVGELETALRLDPTSTPIRADRANALFFAGRAHDAIGQLEGIAAAAPGFAPAHRYLAMMYLAAGDPARSVAALAAEARAAGDANALAVAAAAAAGLARGGEAGMAAAIRGMRQAQDDAQRSGAAAEGVSPYALAQSYAAVDPARAMRLLESSLAAGESAAMGIAADPALAPLRRNPKFRALEVRLRLLA